MLNLERQGPVAWLTLTDPAKRNAMGPEFWDGLAEQMDQINADSDVRVMVIRGAGTAFSSGLDLPAMMGQMPMMSAPNGADKARLHRLIRHMQGAITSVERCRVPVIAAICGPCIGGGLDLATACDIRLCSADALFSVRETRLAMVADVGTLQRLPALVGPGIAREWIYTGRDFGAEEALRHGLVTRVLRDADALFAAATDLAKDIAAAAPLAVQGAKAVMIEAERYRIDRSLEYVATWNAAHLVNEDLGRAVAAFMAKAPPEFQGT